MKQIIEAINELMVSINRPVKLMEVCGTHTVAIFRHGIRELLPKEIKLLSGPGCPVCVTSIRDVDTVIEIARHQDASVTTFGDMMRVPGSRQTLSQAKAEGGDIRIVYSPLDALKLAEHMPQRTVVFFATGFETTSPLVAATLAEAESRGIRNFFIYSVHKTVPPALKALLSAPEVQINGFILPGHVSTVIGLRPYAFLAAEYHKPSVVTGFDAGDILSGVLMLLKQIACNRPAVENEYAKVVKEEGNPRAVALLDEFFEPEDSYWRGLGILPDSGLKLRDKYSHRDIMNTYTISVPDGQEPKACSCGDVLKGIKIPTDCTLFGKACTPDKPVGACMVSTEGSCAAYFKYAGADFSRR
ncbi:MAG: hydrogenase formation protein HypD [Nitrospirae bacterium]|nr:hydrogenase formation protein HypD [Nitrospirota bacterium]